MEISNPGYYWLDTWVLANIIQLATQEFCAKYLNQNNDPCGRQYDQMTQAARSVPANIAEGNSRHSTSKETEMKLSDVARASLSELTNDYINWLLCHDSIPWSAKSTEHKEVFNVRIDHPVYKEDIQHQSCLHIVTQKHRFDKWLLSKDSLLEANCLIILCNRLSMMLRRQITSQFETFKNEGGFTEALTAERLANRTEKSVEENAPTCPKCGKPMIRRVAQKGKNSGKEFWSCSAFPNCNGTRSMVEENDGRNNDDR